MENKLKCKPLMLPGDGPVFNCPDGLYERHLPTPSPMHRHLYLISDREIELGDWYYYKHFGCDCGPIQFQGDNEINNKQNLNNLPRFYFKIEASTDLFLSLPGIPDYFIKEYVEKQGKIEMVYIAATVNISGMFNPVNFNRDVMILTTKYSWNREELKNVLMELSYDLQQGKYGGCSTHRHIVAQFLENHSI